MKLKPSEHVLVWAGIASIPARERSLRLTVASLLPQVDRLCVHLNGYDGTPNFLKRSKIKVTHRRRRADLGDAGKFMRTAEAPGYFLGCDDDLIFPADYVTTTVAGIERHGRRAVVGYYGRLLSPRGRKIVRFHFLSDQADERRVHLLGSGVCGFYAPGLGVCIDDFPHPNMADAWLALWAKRREVPLIVLPHAHGWLQQTNHARTIWSESMARTGSAMDTSAAQERALGSTTWMPFDGSGR